MQTIKINIWVFAGKDLDGFLTTGRSFAWDFCSPRRGNSPTIVQEQGHTQKNCSTGRLSTI